jgi:hypothetical protein
VPDADLPVLKEAFLDGLQAARRDIPNPHVDFDRGCAFALGQHWDEPPDERRVYFEQAQHAGIMPTLAHYWVAEKNRG